MYHKYLNTKGFTLMELLVTVILVAVLASYSVYHYNTTIDEGKLRAAEGKMAALGGALERYKLENNAHFDNCNENPVEITSSNITGNCGVESSIYGVVLLNVFYCGYAEKSLGLDENFKFYFGCPSDCGVESNINEFVVYMKPSNANPSSVFPTCAYFDPVHDRAVEVEGE